VQITRTNVTPAVAGPIVLLGGFLFALIFIMSGPRHFLSPTISYAAAARRSSGVNRGADLRIAGDRGGSFPPAWVSSKTGGKADRVVSCRRYANDAADSMTHLAEGHVFEESFDARRGAHQFTAWARTVGSGCWPEIITT